MPPLLKKGIKDKDNYTVLSLRGALATKQSRFCNKGNKNKKKSEDYII